MEEYFYEQIHASFVREILFYFESMKHLPDIIHFYERAQAMIYDGVNLTIGNFNPDIISLFLRTYAFRMTTNSDTHSRFKLYLFKLVQPLRDITLKSISSFILL